MRTEETARRGCVTWSSFCSRNARNRGSTRPTYKEDSSELEGSLRWSTVARCEKSGEWGVRVCHSGREQWPLRREKTPGPFDVFTPAPSAVYLILYSMCV